MAVCVCVLLHASTNELGGLHASETAMAWSRGLPESALGGGLVPRIVAAPASANLH